MKKVNLLSPVYAAAAFMASAMSASAQNILRGDELPPAAGTTTDLRTGVVSIINYILLFLGLVAVAYIIWAGIKMVTSGGNEGKVKEGQKTITYAALGLLIIFLSYAIVAWVTRAPSGTA